MIKSLEAKFIRDSATNSLINTDTEAYYQYKQTRIIDKQLKTMHRKIERLESLVAVLNDKITKLEQNG